MGDREIRFEPLPNYGDHMTMKDFIKCCKSGGFIDYDGHGVYATETQRTNSLIFPSDVTSGKVDKEFTHVVWFNK